MKKYVLFLLLAFLGSHSYGQKVILTLAMNINNTKEKYVFIDTDNPAIKNELINKFKQSNYKVINQSVSDSIPVVIYNNVLTREKAANNCLAGAGFCLLGIGTVSITGKQLDPNNPPSGLNANVGTTYVDGPLTALVGAMYATGCVFGIRGIVAMFKANASIIREYPIKTTEKSISSYALFNVGSESIEINGVPDVESKLIPKIIAKMTF